MEIERNSHRVILFDMDNTLLRVREIHAEGFRIALQTVYGVVSDGKQPREKYQGHPEPTVIRIMCREAGVEPDAIEAGLAEAMRIKDRVANEMLPQDLRGAVLPGVVELLGQLARQGHVLGVVTGTAVATARPILERAGLWSCFAVSAFGNEGTERVDLLHLALKRAGIQGVPAPESEPRVASRLQVVVIGDSPRDVQAGQAIGARTVAVGTGFHGLEELATYQPDALLPNLEGMAALEAILGSAERAP